MADKIRQWQYTMAQAKVNYGSRQLGVYVALLLSPVVEEGTRNGGYLDKTLHMLRWNFSS